MNCLDIVIKVTGAVLAVVTAVTAVVALLTATVVTGGAILFAVASCVTAVIAVLNAVTNVVTSVQSIVASSSGDLAMSKIYSDRDTLAQVLREHNFHDKKKNRASNAWAAGIEITDTIAGVITMVHSIGKIAGGFLSKNGVGFAFKELVRGSDGKLTTKVTLKSIWRGTKALVLNKGLTDSTSAGLRTTLLTNVKESFKYQATLFKLAVRDPGSWKRAKEVGDIGFFKNCSEKLKYNWSQFKNVFSNIEMVLSGLGKTDDKGLFRRISEKFVQKKFFDNDLTKLIKTTGLGELCLGFDKSKIIKDYTGISKGIIQKLASIKKSAEHPMPYFSEMFPQFECERLAG